MAYKDPQKRIDYFKVYYLKNRDKIRAQVKKYADNNKDAVRARRKTHYENNKESTKATMKKYRESNREQIAAWHRQNQMTPEFRKARRKYLRDRYHRDVNFKLAITLRNRLNYAIKGEKSGSAVRDLGCTVEQLKFYLEGKFQVGMTWENHGKWHIDHELPLSFFDLSNREEYLKACHYKNLQPLWAQENLRKNKYIKSKTI